MVKCKPKLCRMKRLDVSSKTHFLFTEDDLTGFLSKTEAISYLKLCSANQKENSHICRLFANP